MAARNIQEDDPEMNVGNRKFHITGHLGRGGFSLVKKAYDENTRKKVALKIMFTDDYKSDRERDVNIGQAHKEIKSMRQLTHENIIRLFGYDLNSQYNGRECIVLVQELAQGGELFDYLLYTGKFEEQLAAYTFRSIMAGLFASHDLGIAHRDMKPENVLLDKRFTIKIADYGFAYIYKKNDEILRMRTELGTRGYMAPEISQRGVRYTHKVDYFATGVILFILLAGFPPFRKTESSDWWYDKLNKKKYDLFWMAHEKKVRFSDEAKDMLQGLLNTDQDQRFDKEEIATHPFFTTTDCYTIEEATEHFKKRKTKILNKSENAKDRATATLKDYLHANDGIIPFATFVRNQFREDLEKCADEDDILEALSNVQIPFSAEGIEIGDIASLSAKFAEITLEDVQSAINLPEHPASKLVNVLQENILGIPINPALEGYVHLDEDTALEVVNRADLQSLASYDVRCGFGYLCWFLENFMQGKGEMEVLQNAEVKLTFTVEESTEIPLTNEEGTELELDADGEIQWGTEIVEVEFEVFVKLYYCSITELNRLAFINKMPIFEKVADLSYFKWVVEQFMSIAEIAAVRSTNYDGI